MSRRHNQYRSRITREHGSTGQDLNDKNHVKQILDDLGYSRIAFDYFLGITADDRYEIHASMTESEARQYRRIRHPDVICIDPNGLPLIVEIDGAYHRDYDHDADYDAIGINYIKINKEYLEREEIPWDAWIRDAAEMMRV